MKNKLLTPEDYLQNKIDNIIPKPIQSNYADRIGSIKAGFFWGLEYERYRKQILDIIDNSDKI